MITARRVEIRRSGTILGHDEVGVRLDVVLGGVQPGDADELADSVAEAAEQGVRRAVVQVERPAVVDFSLGGWAYTAFLTFETVDDRARELQLPRPAALARGVGGRINRAMFESVPRHKAEALADYLMDRLVEDDPRVAAGSTSTQQVRDREAMLRRAAGQIRKAAAWQ